jgi:hypothetical protein
MIESAHAKNGSLIYLKDGKFLASSFDPQKEAETWWKNCQKQTKYARTLFVFGLGCGYHIEVLLRQIPETKIIVVEPDQELVSLFQSNPLKSDRFEIVCEQDWRRLFQHSSVGSAVQDKYAVLLHPASFGLESDFFGNAYKFLLARSVEGLFALLKHRPDILSEMDEAKLSDLARSGTPVTIHTLTKTMKSTSFLNDNRRLWKVLEELIA